METRRASQRLNHPTWALGFLAVFLLAAEILTGMGLLFHYRPTAGTAWLDLVDLREASSLGFLRDLHFWGSHLLLVAVWLHLLRTFASGLYKPPGQRNWTVGVLLLVLTVALAYTGSLLPWDEESVRSVTVREPSLAAAAPPQQLGPSDLGRFFALHCGLLPAMAIGLAVWHWRLARVRNAAPDSDGGSGDDPGDGGTPNDETTGGPSPVEPHVDEGA